MSKWHDAIQRWSVWLNFGLLIATTALHTMQIIMDISPKSNRNKTLGVVFLTLSIVIISMLYNPLTVVAQNARRLAPADIPDLLLGRVIVRVKNDVENMGVVWCLDVKTQKLLWHARLYKVIRDKKLEDDVQDVHIRKIWSTGSFVYAEDELGRVFKINLSDGVFTREK